MKKVSKEEMLSIIEALLLSSVDQGGKPRVVEVLNHEDWLPLFWEEVPYENIAPYMNQEGAANLLKSRDLIKGDKQKFLLAVKGLSKRFPGSVVLDDDELDSLFSRMSSSIFKLEGDKNKNRESLRDISLLLGFKDEIDCLKRVFELMGSYVKARWLVLNIVSLLNQFDCEIAERLRVEAVKIAIKAGAFSKEDDENYYCFPEFYGEVYPLVRLAATGSAPVSLLGEIEGARSLWDWEVVLLSVCEVLRNFGVGCADGIFKDFAPLDQAQKSLMKQLDRPIRLIPKVRDFLLYTSRGSSTFIDIRHRTSIEDLCRIYDLIKLFLKENPNHPIKDNHYFDLLFMRLSFLEFFGCWNESRLKRFGFIEEEWFDLECLFTTKRIIDGKDSWDKEIAKDFLTWLEGKKLADLVGGDEERGRVRKDRWI